MLPTLHGRKGLVSAVGMAGLALTLASGSALASVTISFNGWSSTYENVTTVGNVAGYSGSNTVNLDHSVAASTLGSVSGTGLTGADAIAAVSGSLAGVVAGSTIQAYCVDMFHSITIGSNNNTYNYDAQVVASNNGNDPLATEGAILSGTEMYRWTQAQINEITALLVASQGVTDSSATAAFQIAIWEIEYDQGTTLSAGSTFMNFSDGSGNGINFQGLTTTIATDAQADYTLAKSFAGTSTANEAIYELSNAQIAANSAQNGNATTPQTLIYLVTTSGGGGATVGSPEPGTVGLLGAGLSALWAAARRRRRA